jgi:hypothetical protein
MKTLVFTRLKNPIRREGGDDPYVLGMRFSLAGLVA